MNEPTIDWDRLMRSSVNTVREEAIEKFREAIGTIAEIFEILRQTVDNEDLHPRIREKVHQARMCYDEAFAKLEVFLFVKGELHVKYAKHPITGEKLPDEWGDVVEKAVYATCKAIKRRHAKGKVEDADSLVDFSVGILLWGNRKEKIKSKLQQFWDAKLKKEGNNTTSINQQVTGQNGDPQPGIDTIPGPEPPVITVVMSADAIVRWYKALGDASRDGPRTCPPPEKARDTEAPDIVLTPFSRLLARHPKKRLALKALRLFLRQKLCNADVYNWLDNVCDERRREDLLDEMLSGMPIGPLVDQANLQSFVIEIGQVSDNRGFEFHRDASEFFQRILMVDSAAQEVVKRRLERVVYPILHNIARQLGSDMFGIWEWAAALCNGQSNSL